MESAGRERGWGYLTAVMIVVAVASPASAQTSAALDLPWSGSARCRIDVQGPGYTSQQTHTWTLTGGAPAAQGAIRLHPARWEVTGSGSLQRSNGTQSLDAQWSIAAQAAAPISIVVRASDGHRLIRSGHAQLRQAGGISGTQTQTVGGKASSTPIAAEAFEWTFPALDELSGATRVAGSNRSEPAGSVAFMQPAGSRAVATCEWDFAQAGARPSAPTSGGGAPSSGGQVSMPTPAGTPAPAGAAPSAGGAPSAPGNPPPTTSPVTPTVVPLPPQVLQMPPPNQPAPSASGGEQPAATRANAPAVATAPSDAYEPNNSREQAKSIGQLTMRAQPLVIRGTFDTAADVDDWFTVRILDDGTPPEAGVLNYRDHHLTVAFTNPAYQLLDYPLYQITVTATDGFLVTRQSETMLSPSVNVPWQKTAQDDSKSFVIQVRRLSGQPSSNEYSLVLQAD